MGLAQDFLAGALASSYNEACIRWPYATSSNGYPKMFIGGATTSVHRHVCRLTRGDPSDESLDAAHDCGDRTCINPAHISWKSHHDNMQDMIAHGRSTRGERSNRAKLTRADVREIRRVMGDHAPYKANFRDVAQQFGVAAATIQQIARRAKWKWLV